MSESSSFFILEENVSDDVSNEPQYNRQLFNMPEYQSKRPEHLSKFIKKWTEYVDDSIIPKSVDLVNGDVSYALPIVKVNLTPLLKIDIDIVYMYNKEGTDYEIPLTKNFISVDHQNSVFRNDAIYYMNSMGSKMTLESVGPNTFKMLEDIKGEIDVTYYEDHQYFVVESALEKIIYGSYGNTGTTLYELSYKHWRETGSDPQNLIRIPVGWFIAERHSKADGRSIYYHYENVNASHGLNSKVSYTSEVMLMKITDGNDVTVEFGYGTKENGEMEQIKQVDEQGNLRIRNLQREKHYVKSIKVRTEDYEQNFEIKSEVVDGKLRVFKGISQMNFRGSYDELLTIQHSKLYDRFVPIKMAVAHGLTTKLAYENQGVPTPILEKSFLLKNRPVISYGIGTLSFASIIDNRVVLKIFDIKTFKFIKEFSIVDPKTIEEGSLQVNFSQNYLVASYKTNDGHHLKIFHQKDHQKWYDKMTSYKYTKDSKIHTTGRDFIVVQDGKMLVVLQKIWNEMSWLKFEFQTGDEKMKTFIRGKSIFLREQSHLHAVFKTDDGRWGLKLLKSNIPSTSEFMANVFDVKDNIREGLKATLDDNEIKVVNNMVIFAHLKIESSGQLRTVFNFITVGDGYEILKTEEFFEDHENITELEKKLDGDGNTMVIKYRSENGKYVLRLFDIYGKIDDEINKIESDSNNRRIIKNHNIQSINKDEKFQDSMRGQFLLNWDKYYPFVGSGGNELFFGQHIKFSMTGAKWTKGTLEKKREVKLGDSFKLIFNKDEPKNVKLLNQKDGSLAVDMRLYEPNTLINVYPHYIAYQTGKAVTKLIIFDDGKSILKQETFNKEALMFESNRAYIITLKKSEDATHSEPYELIIRNVAQFLADKPHPIVNAIETTRNSDSRITKYNRKFINDKKLWTVKVEVLNSNKKADNGHAEYLITRNDEADIKQVVSYYDSDGQLLKSEKKDDGKQDDKDYSDHLLYDASGTLQISNFIPYRKSENAFGYFGFEDYEEIDGWTFKSQKIVKSENALTGSNFLRLSSGESLTKSFVPKNKNEIFTISTWMRTNLLNVNDSIENFKAVISYGTDATKFTELYGILGHVKDRNGEWIYAEISVDFANLIRTGYDEIQADNKNIPKYEDVDIKVTIVISGIQNSQIDVDNVVYHPAPHGLDVQVFNKNRDVTTIIHNNGQISRIFYDFLTNKEIGRTKKNGKLDQFLVRSEGEKDLPKTVTKFNPTSGFHEAIDKVLFTNRWRMTAAKNWKLFPSELMYIGETVIGKIEIKDHKIIDEKSAALRMEVSLGSLTNSNFEVKFKKDVLKFESNGSKTAAFMIGQQKIAEIPLNFELVVFKYNKRTIVWINGVVQFDKILQDTWKGFILNFRGTTSVRNIFILNNPKIEIYYHNNFDEKQQVIKLEDENSAIVTEYIYDKFGREIVKTKPTRVIKSPSESLLKFHSDFVKSFNPQTHKMEGEVVVLNPIDEGFPYEHIAFRKNPLNEKQKVGKAGKKFSLQSSFASSYDKAFDFPFLNAFFPDTEGFMKQAENLANGSKRVLVFDKNDHKVAKYIYVPNFDDLLITYEYDSEGRVIKILSPEYHEAAKTTLKTNEIWRSGTTGLTEEEKELQEKLGTHFKYDQHGNMIEKRTPDVGRQIFLYNSMNLLKFAITFDANPHDGQTIYYNYDSSGGLMETGQVTRPVSVEYLKKFVESNFHTQSVEFQKIQFIEGKSKVIETINHETTVIEELKFDENDEDKVTSMRLTVPSLAESLQNTFEFRKTFIGDHVDELTYPPMDDGKILKIKNTYNGIGQLIGIGIKDNPYRFARFTYDANGQPTSETHELNALNRKYVYNSPGYLSKIDDSFLSEEISYIDGGYGQLGYGDGIVMKTAYHAKWSDNFFKRLDENTGDDEEGSKDYEGGVFENENGEDVEDSEDESDESRRKRDISGIENFGKNSIRDAGSEDSWSLKNLNLIDKITGIPVGKISKQLRNRKSTQNLKISRSSFPKRVSFNLNIHEKKSGNFNNINSPFTKLLRNNKNISHSVDPHEEAVITYNSEYNTYFHNYANLEQDNSGKSQELSQNIRYKRSTSTQSNRQQKIEKIIENLDSDTCISTLKNSNFLSEKGFRFEKLLNTNTEVELPVKCYDNNIYDEISATHQIPSYYGHRFAYGTHMELVKAKYFSTKEEEEADPLQMHTFHEKIPGIAFYKSHNIFNILRNGNFITVDQRRDDKKSSIGVRGTISMIRDADLTKVLLELNKTEQIDFMSYYQLLKQLILHTIENKKYLKVTDFESIYLKWTSTASGTFKKQLDDFKRQSRKLYNGLIQKKLLPTSVDTLTDPLNPKLLNDLKSYTKSQIVGIVSVVSNAFNHQLLTAAFDIASHEIDPNGNHKKFSTGFDHVKLNYHKYTSKIKELEIKGEKFSIEHDGYANMTSAPHKGVKAFIYHPVSRRVMEVLLKNGTSIKFHYNAQGERIIKQVFDEKFQITKEIFYVRDHKGNVLMDRVMMFDQNDKTCYDIVTHYIYGPRGLIGFIRDNKFHSVFIDHSGSIRLVIKDGMVAAAYDYLPYGELMRKFSSDESAEIRYLYHGKELDDEFSMYNFHARFYDPTIGRFLQTDPQSQYFSPYKFSGNSPVSFVDPDGEIAFIICLGFGLLGGYLGASSANKNFKFWQWNLRDPGTYIGFAVGFLTGYAMPGAVVSSVSSFGFIATGVTMSLTAYVSAAAANKSWNPKEWNFNEPETYSALFSGLATGASALNGIKSFHSYSKTLSLAGKIKLYSFASITASSAFFLSAYIINGGKPIDEWRFDKPEMIKAMLDGFMLGTSIPVNSGQLISDFVKFKKDPKYLKEFVKNLSPSKIKNMKTFFADRNHPLYKFVGSLTLGYVMASLHNKNFDPTKWNYMNPGTYGAALGGMVSGKNLAKGLTSMTKSTVKARISKEWKDTIGIGRSIKGQYTKFKQNILSLKTRGIEKYKRYFSKNTRPPSEHQLEIRNRVAELEQQFNNQAVAVRRSMSIAREFRLDRSTKAFSRCATLRRKRTIFGGFCGSITTKLNALRERFTRKDLNAVFEDRTIVLNIPRLFSDYNGYVTLMPGGLPPGDISPPPDPNTPINIIPTPTPTPNSVPSLVITNETKIEFNESSRRRRSIKPTLAITEQVRGATIYTREIAGKFEIYLQRAEPESEIALSIDVNGKFVFYDTQVAQKIFELDGVDIPRLFDANSNEIKRTRGTFKFPNDGVIKYLKDGKMKLLKTINGQPIKDVVRKNLRIRQKNAENLNKNLPNFNEFCDTCKAIHWEDHLPAGMIDSFYHLNIDKPLKITAAIYKNDENDWKLISQLVQFDKKNRMKPSIADIRQKPKIFDLKLSKKMSDEESIVRKTRNINFIPETTDIPSNKFYMLENGTEYFDQAKPSMLNIGDHWLNTTSLNSNLTLAYAFMKKWMNEKFETPRNNAYDMNISKIEYNIFANEILEDFTKIIQESAVASGMSRTIQEFLISLDYLYISKNLKDMCENYLTDEIPKYLLREFLEKNEVEIIRKSSIKQFEALKRIVTENFSEFIQRVDNKCVKFWEKI